MSFTVRSYRPGDEDGILALFHHVFRQPRGMAHWRWKFAGNPAGRQISLAVSDAGRIVGQLAGLPAHAATPDEPFVLSQGVDHMVHPDFQGRGVFAALTRHFVARHLPPARDVVFYSFPLARKHAIDVRISRAELVHQVVALRRDLAVREPWREAAAAQSRRRRVVRVARFGRGVDRLWERLAPESGAAIVRDARYLNWRYADCPDTAYALLQVETRLTGQVLGAAVLRFGWFDEKLAPLLELLAPPGDPATLGLLVGACHDLAREHRLDAVKTWIPAGAPLHPALRALGYAVEETPFLLTRIAERDPRRAAALRRLWTYSMGDSDIY